MLWTLQKYIFREMGKSFVLTAIGLIAVLGLGGGVMNMIELQGASALQLLKIIGLILPVAATLTLPIAALYSATVTYGRLSADNEFVACRSGGINVHVLFLPTLVISLVSALFSFFFINFLIPGMIMNLDRFVGADLPLIIRRQLNTPRRLALKRDEFHIYADTSELTGGAPDDPSSRPAELRLDGVAFVEMDNNNWARFGTARQVLIRFDTEAREATVSGDMYGLSLYDAKAGRYNEHAHEPIGRIRIPQTIPLKVKWLKLGDLLQYRRQPSLFPKIERYLARLRAGISATIFCRELQEQFQRQGEAVFGGKDVQYLVRGGGLSLTTDGARPFFESDVTVTEIHPGGVRRTVTADTAEILIDHGGVGGQTVRAILRAAGNVTIRDSRAPGGVIRRERERFSAVGMPEPVLRRAEAYVDDDLLEDTGESLGLGKWVDEEKRGLIARVGKVSRDITGVLHSRMAFSLSVFVLVVLGAALGIVFRGAHVLTAFGISFVPSLFVITMIIMGKQLIDNPATTTAGVGVVWLGILIMAAVDVFVLMRLVRR